MTATALSDRRARLKVVISEEAETAHIERILHTRLRERRERRGAMARREAEHQKQAPWADPKQIVGEGNPHELETAVRSGRVRIRFVHTSRWWQWKEATPREAIRFGSDGKSLVDGGGWELRVNKEDWRAHFCKPDASLPSADVLPPPTETVRLRPAPETEIQSAIGAEYEEAEKAGRKAPNIKEVPRLAQARLRAKGFYASQRKIARIAEAFKDRRRQPGRTLKSEKVTK
jgi:hypothetical protein